MSKTIKKCAVCQESFADRFSFCPNCGAPLQILAEESAPAKAEARSRAVTPFTEEVASAPSRPMPTETLRNNHTAALDTSKLDRNFAKNASEPFVETPSPYEAAINAEQPTEIPNANPSNFSVPQNVASVGVSSVATKAIADGAARTQVKNEPLSKSSVATSRVRGEYNPTILEEKGIISRLGDEFSNIAQESRLTLPEFKRDPVGFTGRAVKGFGSATVKALTQENVGVGLLAAFVILLTLSGAIYYFDRLQKDRIVAQINETENPDDVLLTDLTEPTPQPTPEPGNVGTAKGDGGGQLAEKKKPSGGGGGGREQQEPPSGGKLPPASLNQQILLPNPDPVRNRNADIKIAATIKADPTLFPDDKRNLPVGVPGAKNTTPSSGPGTGGGIGTGSNGGVGTGRGGGVGPGEGGNAGGGQFGLGGGGADGGGGGGKNPPPVKTPTPKPTPEIVLSSEPVRIIAKPRPNYTEQARTEQVTGTVILKIVFNANGTIGGITVVKGLPYGLTENAIAVARQIRFEPATKNGKPVSVAKNIEYGFNQY